MSACATITLSTTQLPGASSRDRGAVIEAPRDNQSALWGASGERADSNPRLIDFSYAGYAFGNKPLPQYRTVASVTDFGAVPDDGRDDTAAFRRAIARTDAGAIEIPEGRFEISDVINLNKPRIVLRGQGPDKTTIHITKALEDVEPTLKPGEPKRTLKWSWSSGFFRINGSYTQSKTATITAPAQQGSRVIRVDDPKKLSVGARVIVVQSNPSSNSLIDYLYANDPGDYSKLNTKLNVTMHAIVESISGSNIILNRPLRWDLRSEWNPVVRPSQPHVYDVGIEHLAIEFDPLPYEGHFTERGRNAVAIGNAYDCWIRNVEVRNCDSGFFVHGYNNTLKDITFTSEREPYLKTYTGHHGITLGIDNLLDGFNFDTVFYHEITLTRRSAGNVSKNGRGVNIAFDHHKSVNHANLFSNIDVGKGTRIWKSGGSTALGKHAGAWTTFWNIRADTPINSPPDNFAPDLINIVGITTTQPKQTSPTGKWFEPLDTSTIEPKDLHEAQLRRRGASGN